MKKRAALVALSILIIPMVSWGDYVDDITALKAKASENSQVPPTVKTVDVSKYSLTEIEIKKSLIRVLMARGWKIQKQTRYKVTAQYKDTIMDVNIKRAKLEFREVSHPCQLDNGWIIAAAEHLMMEAEYYYQVNQAKKLIDSVPE